MGKAKDALAAAFARGEEHGSASAVTIDGETVIDLWGGDFDGVHDWVGRLRAARPPEQCYGVDLVLRPRRWMPGERPRQATLSWSR